MIYALMVSHESFCILFVKGGHCCCNYWVSITHMFGYICIVNNAHGYVNELYYMHFHIKIKSFFLTYAILKFPSFYVVLLYPMDDKL